MRRPESTKQRPAHIDADPAHAIAYDWLEDNGINEWLPEYPIFEIRGRRLSYTAFKWRWGRRGWNAAHIVFYGRQAVIRRRTVRLRTPPTERVLDALRRSGALVQIIE